MLKKLFMLPLMGFALLTLSAATVTEDGEDIFEVEIIEENTSLPSDDADEEISFTDNNYEWNTNIYNNNQTLDVYISGSNSVSAVLYYNYLNQYTDYSDTNMWDTDLDFYGNADEYIHIRVSEYNSNQISVIGGPIQTGNMEDGAPDIDTLNEYNVSKTFFEEFGGALSTIVTAGSAVFVSTFDGLWDVFWDADANNGDGALNWIAYVAVLPVGFFLVRWAFRKVLGMIQQRL